MRLGQLARKFDVPVQDILSFLQENDKGELQLHPNTKLDKATEDKLAKHFDISDDWYPESLENGSKEIIKPDSVESESKKEVLVEETIAEELNQKEESVLEDIAQLDDSVILNHVEVEEKETFLTEEPLREEMVIESDKLLEMLESEESDLDLDKITRIKAPKKELDGLKVVGKIELPEPKPKKETKEVDENEAQNKNTRNKRNQLTPEEREKRRLQAKRKKEDYERRLEKRRIEKEQKELKAKKRAHYEQKLSQTTVVSPERAKDKSKEISLEEKPIREPQKSNEPYQQRSLPGRFWRWLNGG